jgi:hypothetical protein
LYLNKIIQTKVYKSILLHFLPNCNNYFKKYFLPKKAGLLIESKGTFFFYAPAINAWLKVKCVPIDSKSLHKKAGLLTTGAVYK